LSNKNENATILKTEKFSELNKAFAALLELEHAVSLKLV
jgi:hypothetical protein